MKNAILLSMFISVILPLISLTAFGIEDGIYDATVTTSSGTYSVPVEVEDGEVTSVHWPNGGNMAVNGADIEDGEASGYNSRGENINVEIEE